MELMQASQQWNSRTTDERFTSLPEMAHHFQVVRDQSKQIVLSSRSLRVTPTEDNRGLMLSGPAGVPYAPTHLAFGQLAQRVSAPAGYLRGLPAPVAADCLNWGLRTRDIEEVGVLLQKNGESIARCVTGPNYGRIWNAPIISALVDRFGDGISGDFRVPGEFGQAVTVSKANTTLFAGDRDMFIFLADENHKIEIANRRDGKSGMLSRGFFVWNSEVGARTFGIATFLFDYVCRNRIVWGATEYAEIKMRHTSGAPDRWLDEVMPAIQTYAQSSTGSITRSIEDARAKRIDDVDDFLATRFGPRAVAGLHAIHKLEENRPIETLWDAATAVTAKARSIDYQDQRVTLERAAGDILALAA